MTDDIVTRLLALNHPDAADAADEIERLQEQLQHSHSIIASEAFAWLMSGANHLNVHIEQLQPAVLLYWKKHGNYFKKGVSQ